jgi:hypothetical protein
MKTMKTIVSVSSVLAALALAMLPAKASTYTATGNFNGSGADGKAISSVVVNNTASDITFTINSSQTMAAWIFYAVDIQIIGQAGSGYTGLSNPIWGGSPTLGISTGENAVLDFNNDGSSNTGGIPFKYSGGSWVAGSSVSYAAGGAGSTFATLTVPLSSLGLSVGDSFYFDAVSTYTSWAGSPSGPQSAYSALDSVSGYPAETDSSWQPWLGSNSYDSATDASGTTFGTAASLYVVPEPATLGLLSGGVILLLVQRRRVSGNRAA